MIRKFFLSKLNRIMLQSRALKSQFKEITFRMYIVYIACQKIGQIIIFVFVCAAKFKNRMKGQSTVEKWFSTCENSDFTFVKNFYIIPKKEKRKKDGLKLFENYFIAKLVPASKNKTVTIDHFRHVKTKLFHHQRLAIYSLLRYIKRNCIGGNNRGYKSAANYFFTSKNQEKWREKSTVRIEIRDRV